MLCCSAPNSLKPRSPPCGQPPTYTLLARACCHRFRTTLFFSCVAGLCRQKSERSGSSSSSSRLSHCPVTCAHPYRTETRPSLPASQLLGAHHLTSPTHLTPSTQPQAAATSTLCPAGTLRDAIVAWLQHQYTGLSHARPAPRRYPYPTRRPPPTLDAIGNVADRTARSTRRAAAAGARRARGEAGVAELVEGLQEE